jgi:hypothetical protein
MKTRWSRLFLPLFLLCYLVITSWFFHVIIDSSGTKEIFLHFKWSYLKVPKFYAVTVMFGIVQAVASYFGYLAVKMGEDLAMEWASYRNKERPRIFQEPGTCARIGSHGPDVKADFVVVENGASKYLCQDHLADYLQANPRALAAALTDVLALSGARRSGQLWPR